MKEIITIFTTAIIFVVICLLVGTNLVSSSGRYQLVQISEFRKDQFLVDTKEGRVWHNVCVVSSGQECEYGAFVSLDIEGINISYDELFEKAKLYEKKR